MRTQIRSLKTSTIYKKVMICSIEEMIERKTKLRDGKPRRKERKNGNESDRKRKSEGLNVKCVELSERKGIEVKELEIWTKRDARSERRRTKVVRDQAAESGRDQGV
jgi:hypothetical protein